MGVKVTVKKRGPGIDAVFRKMQAIDSLTLTVGVQGAKAAKMVGRKSSGRTSLGSIAVFNEFGTDKAPARPFLRPAVFENREETARAIAKEMEIYVSRPQRDALTTLSNIGKGVAFKVKARVENARGVARLDPDTIKAKRSSRPLVDTGRLARSITWAVRGPSGSIISEGAAR